MTNKNKRIILSTLCMATITSFAVGGIMAHNANVTASAETEATFYMGDGAEVSVSAGYGGVRWTTTVTNTYLEDKGYNAETSKVYFGTIVAPESMLENGIEDLTVENARGEESAFVNITVGALDLTADEVTYRSAIRYDDIVKNVQASGSQLSEAEILKQAYKLELTARSYVTIDGVTHYAEVSDSTRSARHVANAAVLAGATEDLDATIQTRVKSYIGNVATAETEVLYDISSNGAIATDYTGSGTDVLIGAKKMNASVESGVISFAEGQTFKAGEGWISVFDDDGVYNIPAVIATKILTQAEDFAIFKANNDTWSGTGTLTEGYYVLGNDIDARNYVHGASATGLNSANIEMWAGTKGGKFGFTGTFDGRGHKVEGMTVSDYGIFGAVKNATIKNVAFTQVFRDNSSTVSHGAVLGGFIVDATLENIYVEANVSGGIKDASGTAYPKNTLAVVSDLYNCDLTNCVFNMGKTYAGTSGVYYGSFARTSYWAEDTTKMEDVYIVSDLMLTHKGTENGEVDAENTSEFTSGYAGTKTTSSKIKRYESVANMQADTANNYDSFGDMWYLNNGMPVWNGTTGKGVSENAVSVVIDMFSAMDGDIDLVTAFGANEGDTVVLNKAYQESRMLTVEDNKIKGVEPVFVMKDGRKDDVAVVPVTLVGTVNGVEKTVSVGLKAYTKVIDEASDLAIFVDTDSTTAYNSVLANSFDGYYILKGNIDASAYTHTAFSWAASMGVNQLKSNKYFMGLRGTFDGNGYTIDGLGLTSGGLFGAINGGTVKDVAFTNVTLGSAAYGAVLCWYASETLVSNVYAEIDAYSTRGKYDGALIGDTYQSRFENVLVVAPTYTASNEYGFGSFAAWYTEYNVTSGTQTSYDNVYVISSTVLCQRFWNASGKTELKYVIDGENRTDTSVSGYTTYNLTGIYRYDNASAAGNVSGGYWSIDNGTIAWVKN